MVLPLLCCAHNTMMCFCVARIWESRDHGTLYFFALRAFGSPAHMVPYIFCFFALRAFGSPAHMVPYIFVARIWESRAHGTLYFCCAHAAEVEVKETRSGHVPYGVGFTQLNKRVLYCKRGVSKNQILEN